MPGRKAHPTALKILKGNPGKRPLNADEPVVEPAIPDPPRWLGAAARGEWERLAPLLESARILTTIDRDALAAYCDALAMWEQARARIDEYGLTMVGPNGTEVRRPEVGIVAECWKAVVRFAAEFGMTPSSRSKIHVAKRAAETDPLERFTRRKERRGA